MADWRKMTKEELDHEMSPSRFSHRFSNPDDSINAHVQALTSGSNAARQSLDLEVIKCGESEEQAVHIYTSSELPKECPLLIYIHGGYWQFLTLGISSFMSESFVSQGAAVAAVGYDLAPKATMEEILEQTACGVGKAIQWAAKRGSSGVYISGHSAGGQLSIMMLTIDWKLRDVPFDLVKGIIPVSGVFDLRPLVPTYVNEPLHMTQESAWALSPMNHVTEICKTAGTMRMLVVYAEHDSPQFQVQSQQMTAELSKNGCNVEKRMVENADHFNVIEDLAQKDYSITKEILSMMEKTEKS